MPHAVCQVQEAAKTTTSDLLLAAGANGAIRWSGKFVEILCLVGWLSLNSLSICAITVRVEPDLHVSHLARCHRHDYDLMWFGSRSTLRYCCLRSCWRQLVSQMD